MNLINSGIIIKLCLLFTLLTSCDFLVADPILQQKTDTTQQSEFYAGENADSYFIIEDPGVNLTSEVRYNSTNFLKDNFTAFSYYNPLGKDCCYLDLNFFIEPGCSSRKILFPFHSVF
ncbi:hypothetical protein [Christiangramia salexigens]|uniref:Uncharacterized protein n=1 Tax=Christiangramia salexigens TaxID=1913577 RepID=A0A1L3J6B1_9FLAO|nr:hypothetical protein [Christiangramia salexigens]APG60643.1 hypothetical protein LPB144_09615 [Christiangramia salexigens]